MLIIDRLELLLLIYINGCKSDSRVEIKYGLMFLSTFLVIIEDSRVSAVNAVKTLNGIMPYGFKKSPKQFLCHNLFYQVKRRENFLRNKFQNCFLLRTCVSKVGLVFFCLPCPPLRLDFIFPFHFPSLHYSNASTCFFLFTKRKFKYIF